MLNDDHAREQQAREIELELIRVRSAAEAARLESRAAELELMLRRLVRTGGSPRSAADASSALVQGARVATPLAEPMGQGGEGADHWSVRLQRLQSREALVVTETDNETLPVFDSSSLFDSDSALRGHGPDAAISGSLDSRWSNSEDSVWAPRLPAVDAADAKVKDEQTWTRAEAGSSRVAAPHFREATADANPVSVSEPAREPNSEKNLELVKEPEHVERDSEELPAVVAKASKPLGLIEAIGPKRAFQPVPKVQPLREVDEEQSPRKFRPASWFVSTLAHLAVLILLGFMTLANNPPKDQLAFTASAAEVSEETMETFSIESSEPTEPTEPVSDTAYEISDMGTMAVTEVSMDVPAAPAAPASSELFSSSSSSLNSSLMKSLKGDSNTKMQFCGVEGGGSHFVYLVDSSKSMRDGFQSARDELLASIDLLKSDQRFYVIFFDEQPSYMRIQDPNVDESTSVMATPENKKRLRRWAMSVEMNEGKAPYDVLPFAIRLRPDVIFLLSDGEFPSRIEEILREQNHEENLFSESRPISIVHTIRYHGIEGEVGRKAEATMVKIAKENGGQYRHVPKPK